MQGCGCMTFLILLGIIPFLNHLSRYLRVQWFSLWYQTKISLSSCTDSSLVDHILAIYSPVRSDPTTSLCPSSKLVGSCYGLLGRFSRSYHASRISSWPKIRIFQVSPQGGSLIRSSTVMNRGGIHLIGTLLCLMGIFYLFNSPPWVHKYLMRHHTWVLRSVP